MKYSNTQNLLLERHSDWFNIGVKAVGLFDMPNEKPQAILLVEGAPAANAIIRRTVLVASNLDRPEVVTLASENLVDCKLSEEAASFAEKRKPNWKGQ